MSKSGDRPSMIDGKEQRYIWLVCNYALWANLPPAPLHRGKDSRQSYDRWRDWQAKYSPAIIKATKEEGVIAQTTGYLDRNIASMISDTQNWDRLKAEGKECKYLRWHFRELA